MILDTITEIKPFPYSSHVYQTDNYFIKVDPHNTRLDREVAIHTYVQSQTECIPRLYETGIAINHKFTRYNTSSTEPVHYALYELLNGQTLYKALLKTGIWPYIDYEDFRTEFLKLLNLLVCMARDSNFKHNDLWTKNIYIVNKQLYLIDFGRASNNNVPYENNKSDIRFGLRVRTMKQVKQYFFNKMPLDKSAEVFSYHGGRLIELDMTNIINLFMTVIYLKYNEKINYYLETLKPWLDTNIAMLNNQEIDYWIRLEGLAMQF